MTSWDATKTCEDLLQLQNLRVFGDVLNQKYKPRLKYKKIKII